MNQNIPVLVPARTRPEYIGAGYYLSRDELNVIELSHSDDTALYPFVPFLIGKAEIYGRPQAGEDSRPYGGIRFHAKDVTHIEGFVDELTSNRERYLFRNFVSSERLLFYKYLRSHIREVKPAVK